MRLQWVAIFTVLYQCGGGRVAAVGLGGCRSLSRHAVQRQSLRCRTERRSSQHSGDRCSCCSCRRSIRLHHHASRADLSYKQQILYTRTNRFKPPPPTHEGGGVMCTVTGGKRLEVRLAKLQCFNVCFFYFLYSFHTSVGLPDFRCQTWEILVACYHRLTRR